MQVEKVLLLVTIGLALAPGAPGATRRFDLRTMMGKDPWWYRQSLRPQSNEIRPAARQTFKSRAAFDRWFNDGKWSPEFDKMLREISSDRKYSKLLSTNVKQWQGNRFQSSSSSYSNYNGVDIRNDHGWDRYPGGPPSMPAPGAPDMNSREWPSWIPPIRMIKLPLDTPPDA